MISPFRWRLAAAFFVSLTVFSGLPLSVNAAEKPNVIIVNMDDIGPAWFPPYARRLKPEQVEEKICKEYADLHAKEGVFDLGKHLEAAQNSTPFLDSLAQSGAVFDRCFSTSSFCAPSRSGLLTGRYQQQWGTFTIPDMYEVGVPANVPMLAEPFKAAGYVCGAVGKWHVAKHDESLVATPAELSALHPPDADPKRPGRAERRAAKEINGYETSSAPGQGPLDRGFDYYFGYNNHASVYYGADDLWNGREREPKRPTDEYLIDLLNGKAASFVQQQVDAKKRFLLYYAPMAVHGALKPPPEKYSAPFHTGIKFSDEYAGHLRAVDEGIRGIYEILKAHGQDKNTLFFFTADNGQNYYRVPPYNAPYRGGKGTGWLGGSHEPLIVSWPAGFGAGIHEELVSHMDIFPTAVEAAGLTLSKPIDGRSLLPLLTGKSTREPHEELFSSGIQSTSASDSYFDPQADANGPHKGDEKTCPLYAWGQNSDSVLMYISKTRPGVYPALPNGLPDQRMFFNLKTDPTESTNAYANTLAIRKANSDLADWLKKLKAPLTEHDDDFNELRQLTSSTAPEDVP